jgi:hypothetical protein
MGATDLIASGDWTVPREGVIFSFEQMMLVPISMPADLLGSYSKARFSIFFSVLGPRLHLHSGLPGFEKARDGMAGTAGTVTVQPCQGMWGT